jgi:hypothetical protein
MGNFSIAMLPVTHERIRQIYEEVMENDGLITPELDQELEALLRESEDTIMDLARLVKELQGRVELSAMWRKEQKKREDAWDERRGEWKQKVTHAMVSRFLMTGEKKIEAGDGRVSLVMTKDKRRIEKAVEEGRQPPGPQMKLEIYDESLIPMDFQEATWSVNTKKVKEALEREEDVPGAKLVPSDPYVTIA